MATKRVIRKVWKLDVELKLHTDELSIIPVFVIVFGSNLQFF